jgi:predicted DNA-binding WGR domain protein
MSTEFGFVGWCNDPAENHDKIWGYFYRPTDTTGRYGVSKSWGWNIVIFWARRGKAMQFKADTSGHELDKLVRSKLKKGYREITQQKFLEIWPSFIQECEEKLMWDVLAGKVK